VAYALAVDGQDGALYVGGWSYGPGDHGGIHFFVAKHNADGSPDLGFGGCGVTKLDLGGSEEQVVSIAVRPDGRIVAAGRTSQFNTWDVRFALFQLRPDGSLDSTFGTDGIVVLDIGEALSGDVATAMALLPGGDVVVAGRTIPWTPKFVVVRVRSDGTVDESFGSL
jgi:uncharacterized delta-60 repeat protein